MARKLKTYQTSVGFFDLAVAAPSMAAALRAWGADTNLFQQGFAKETDDPAIVAATLAQPGVVLRRPVGSDGAFSEHAELPKELTVDRGKERTAKPRAPTREPPAQKVDDKAAREAALAFERERQRRESERRKAAAAREKERKRREQAIAKAEAALEQAKRDHETKVEAIERERAALDRRSQAEDARWEKQKEELETFLAGHATSHVAMAQYAQRIDPSVVPGARPAPFPGFIEPCHPTLRQEAPSGRARCMRSSSMGIARRRTCETASLPSTAAQAMIGRRAFSRSRMRSQPSRQRT
jgi:colicin import membrane protein